MDELFGYIVRLISNQNFIDAGSILAVFDNQSMAAGYEIKHSGSSGCMARSVAARLGSPFVSCVQLAPPLSDLNTPTGSFACGWFLAADRARIIPNQWLIL